MLEEFLWTNDIDIAMLQEVTGPQLDSTRPYTKLVNIGTERRGKAILSRDGLILTDVRCPPSGRGIAAMYNGTRLINIYALSGVERKQERVVLQCRRPILITCHGIRHYYRRGF